MNLLIVGTSQFGKYQKDSAQSYGFLESVLDMETTHAYLDDIIFDISSSKLSAVIGTTGQLVEAYDTLFVRGPGLVNPAIAISAHYLSVFCHLSNIKLINNYAHFYQHTKFAQTLIMQELGLSYPRTIYTVDNHTLINFAELRLGFPYILKANNGSHGDDNFLIKNKQQAEEIIKDNHADFLAQEFCPNDRDFRALIIGQEMLVFERVGSPGSHLNNTSKGATARQTDADVLPAPIREGAYKLANKLGFMIAGVDVMPRKDTEEFIFLEINSQPQLRTGSLLEEKKILLRNLLH